MSRENIDLLLEAIYCSCKPHMIISTALSISFQSFSKSSHRTSLTVTLNEKVASQIKSLLVLKKIQYFTIPQICSTILYTQNWQQKLSRRSLTNCISTLFCEKKRYKLKNVNCCMIPSSPYLEFAHSILMTETTGVEPKERTAWYVIWSTLV